MSWIGLAVGLRLAGFDEPDQLGTLLRFLGGDALLVAAVLRLFRWRATSDSAQLRHALGLAGAGLVFPLTAALTPWTTDGVHLTHTGSAVRVVTLFAVAPLIAGLRTCRPRLVALALLGVAVGLRVAGSHAPAHLDALAPALLASAAALLLGAVVTEFREAAAEPDRAGELELALAVAEARLERARRAQSDRLHDARSAVAGVLGASTVLADHRSSDPDRVELHRAMAAELTRLAGVLDGDADEPVGEFDLRDALSPTLRLHACDGADVTWELAPLKVSGRARATATALDNLLRNARVHAPGAAVRVWTRTRGSSVDIGVDDDGPGIDPTDRRTVLLRGVRVGEAGRPGSGLGLSNVAATMRRQGGDVELGEPPFGGTRVVLSLPAAAALTVSGR